MVRNHSRRVTLWCAVGLGSLVLTAEIAAGASAGCIAESDRVRARQLGIAPGVLAPGPLNAITDVGGVLVGQTTLIAGDSVRTGATAILPHGGNLYESKVPAAVFVLNGYGKSAGLSQVAELGEIESPIVLTNTLSVAKGMEAILDWTLAQPGNEKVVSVNAVVGETNDGYLNDIRRRALTSAHVLDAIRSARTGPVEEGAVGAGTGTIAFGWKGGIGTSSRRLPAVLGSWTVGVLVQTNFGGALTVDGRRIGAELESPARARASATAPATMSSPFPPPGMACAPRPSGQAWRNSPRCRTTVYRPSFRRWPKLRRSRFTTRYSWRRRRGVGTSSRARRLWSSDCRSRPS